MRAMEINRIMSFIVSGKLQQRCLGRQSFVCSEEVIEALPQDNIAGRVLEMD
jgi:hypothetical protein